MVTVCWEYGCRSAVLSANSGYDNHCWHKPSEHKVCVGKTGSVNHKDMHVGWTERAGCDPELMT